MKIGILTLRLYNNYGGILQNYALCKVLQSMGHNVESLHLLQPLSLKCKIKRYLKRVIYKDDNDKDSYQTLTHFVKQYIPQTKFPIKSRRQLYHDEKLQSYDAFIVGSDQVWRRRYMEYGLDAMFLGFIRKSIKIAYAASFGIDDLSEYSKEDIKKTRIYLSAFKAISVREKSGVDICNKAFGLKAVQVLDPTLLLSKEHYQNLAKSAAVPSNGNMLIYFLDPTSEKRNIAEEILGTKKFIPFYYGIYNRVENTSIPSVQQWLCGFNDAEFILTDSFHGCVFSIIYNKPFIVIGNKIRGLTRLASLLALFGLENRLVSLQKSYAIIKILNEDINWEMVNNKLNKLRADSVSFLKKNLS